MTTYLMNRIVTRTSAVPLERGRVGETGSFRRTGVVEGFDIINLPRREMVKGDLDSLEPKEVKDAQAGKG